MEEDKPHDDNSEEKKKSRRRVIIRKRRGEESPFANKYLIRIQELEEEVARLEDKNKRLHMRIAAYHLDVQHAQSEKLKTEKKMRGVLKHVKDTMDTQLIPGGKMKGSVVERENQLLRWKLNIIEKYMHGIFPELLSNRIVIEEMAEMEES